MSYKMKREKMLLWPSDEIIVKIKVVLFNRYDSVYFWMVWLLAAFDFWPKITVHAIRCDQSYMHTTNHFFFLSPHFVSQPKIIPVFNRIVFLPKNTLTIENLSFVSFKLVCLFFCFSFDRLIGPQVSNTVIYFI